MLKSVKRSLSKLEMECNSAVWKAGGDEYDFINIALENLDDIVREQTWLNAGIYVLREVAKLVQKKYVDIH